LIVSLQHFLWSCRGLYPTWVGERKKDGVVSRYPLTILLPSDRERKRSQMSPRWKPGKLKSRNTHTRGVVPRTAVAPPPVMAAKRSTVAHRENSSFLVVSGAGRSKLEVEEKRSREPRAALIFYQFPVTHVELSLPISPLGLCLWTQTGAIPTSRCDGSNKPRLKF
jgi:hypothetical protein